ncbi:SDR family NAD(P)-dependent oxidoreductase [Streptomyces olivochromogenes]|uniref:SDR family NAD(P)-dependent oxidoreductase n=1 Tax=Streptomyces olivochromogenes TaxID=1963 RepID=UPI0036764B7C
MSKTWFITGTSRGFGREWAIAALERGDKVAASARNATSLDDLVATYGDAVLPIALDVTDRVAVGAAVTRAAEHFGRIDIAVNNAGYGHFGVVEEVTEDEVRAQLETNVFGALWVTQAVVPVMRSQGGGHILQVSSIGGIMAAPTLGIYSASKWALEGFSQSLAAEVADFGIKVTIIEPGAFATDWGGASATFSQPLPAYDDFRNGTVAALRKAMAASAPGDPAATRGPVLELVDSENPPLRVLFGNGVLARAVAEYESRLATWREWEPLSKAAHGDVTS